MRIIISIISGLAVGGLLVGLIQTFAFNMYPEAGTLVKNYDASPELIPDGFNWFIISSHIIGCLAGGFITSLINKKKRFTIGMSVALVILGFTVYYNFSQNFPDWARIADIILTAIGGALGSLLGSRGRR